MYDFHPEETSEFFTAASGHEEVEVIPVPSLKVFSATDGPSLFIEEVVKANPGVSLRVSLPSSPWYNLPLDSKDCVGKPHSKEAAKAQAEARQMLRGVIHVASAVIKHGGEFVFAWPTKCLGWLHEDLTTFIAEYNLCLLYTSPSPRDVEESRMPSSA